MIRYWWHFKVQKHTRASYSVGANPGDPQMFRWLCRTCKKSGSFEL